MNEEKYFISEHMETIRKFKGWSQQELAAKLGLKQKTVSNYLANRHTIPATVWFDFCELVDIEPSMAHHQGLEISEIKDLSINQGVTSIGSFKVPAPYARFAGASIRTIQPVKAFMIKHLGADFFREFLKSKGIEIEYTNILNAPINSLLITQMVELLIEKRVLTSPGELMPFMRKDQAVSKFVGKTRNTQSFMSKLMSVTHKADINHEYKIVEANDSEVHLKVRNEKHLNEIIKGDSTRSFLMRYLTEGFCEIINLNGLTAQGFEVINQSKDHTECTLKVIL